MIPPPRLSLAFRPRVAILILFAGCLLTQVRANVKSVQTYKHVGNLFNQLVTSSTLAWESYTGDANQLEYAVQGGRFVTEDEHYPIYVCRAIIDGMLVSGHTEKRKQTNVCMVSMHMEVKTHHAFDVLINRGHGGKLIWTRWTKFTPEIPTGAVSATGAKTSDPYVARHKAQTNQHPQTNAEEHYGADYNLGRFDQSESLGKIIVSEGNREREYEDGEVLIEIEPVRYELREIKINKWRTDIKVNQTYLGFATLSNPSDSTQNFETVISYNYDKVQNWGTHEGVARGLPTKVYEAGRLSNEINWSLKHVEKIIKTQTVTSALLPGTALNVTLLGNYTTLDAPYTATLVAYYADNDDSISRKISASVQKQDMQDVDFQFSPIYWMENGTLLPTTTTTTTTTTTEPTTTSTGEPDPVYSPPVVQVASFAEAGAGHGDATVAASKKNPNDIEDMNGGNTLDGESGIANTGGDSLKLTNIEQNPANLAKDSAPGRQQQHQPLVVLMGSCLMASLVHLITLN